ncbi:MAG: hypothetical protein AAF736_18060 [Pseudomonadota bacterium]
MANGSSDRPPPWQTLLAAAVGAAAGAAITITVLDSNGEANSSGQLLEPPKPVVTEEIAKTV